jgi:hypothetical protein
MFASFRTTTTAAIEDKIDIIFLFDVKALFSLCFLNFVPFNFPCIRINLHSGCALLKLKFHNVSFAIWIHLDRKLTLLVTQTRHEISCHMRRILRGKPKSTFRLTRVSRNVIYFFFTIRFSVRFLWGAI